MYLTIKMKIYNNKYKYLKIKMKICKKKKKNVNT
jgi:hypothetical protein